MPPERWRPGHAPEERTDVFGLGAILFYLLVGRPPMCGVRKFPIPAPGALSREKAGERRPDDIIAPVTPVDPSAGEATPADANPTNASAADASHREVTATAASPANDRPAAAPGEEDAVDQTWTARPAARSSESPAARPDARATTRHGDHPCAGSGGGAISDASPPNDWRLDLTPLDELSIPNWLRDICLLALAPRAERIATASKLAALLTQGRRLRARRTFLRMGLLATGGLLTLGAPLLSSPPEHHGKLHSLKLQIERGGQLIPLEALDFVQTTDGWRLTGIADRSALLELFVVSPSGRRLPLLPVASLEHGGIDQWRFPMSAQSVHLSLPPGCWAVCAGTLRRPRQPSDGVRDPLRLPALPNDLPPGAWSELTPAGGVLRCAGRPQPADHLTHRPELKAYQQWCAAAWRRLSPEFGDLRVLVLQLRPPV
jgi:hypothetical protein